jgi:hypothetical protein
MILSIVAQIEWEKPFMGNLVLIAAMIFIIFIVGITLKPPTDL